MPSSELIEAQRSVMVAVFRAGGLSRATYLKELAEVSRAAAAEGEYGAAMKGYELLGKGLGVLVGDKHLHLHGAVGGAGGPDGGGLGIVRRMASLTDEQLEQLAAERDAGEAEVLGINAPLAVEREARVVTAGMMAGDVDSAALEAELFR
jgi:hypothetical protein